MSKVSKKQNKKRSEIIEAVIPLICSKSFEQISINDICNCAGISVGSFYHYFSKKNDILVGLIGLIDEYLETAVYPMLTHEDEITNIQIFAHGWAKHVENHGLERSILISTIEPKNVDLNGQMRTSVAKLLEIVSRGQKKGQITEAISAEKITEYLLLSFRGMTTDWSRRSGEYNLTEHMDEYIALFLSAVSTQGKTGA